MLGYERLGAVVYGGNAVERPPLEWVCGLDERPRFGGTVRDHKSRTLGPVMQTIAVGHLPELGRVCVRPGAIHISVTHIEIDYLCKPEVDLDNNAHLKRWWIAKVLVKPSHVRQERFARCNRVRSENASLGPVIATKIEVPESHDQSVWQEFRFEADRALSLVAERALVFARTSALLGAAAS